MYVALAVVAAAAAKLMSVENFILRSIETVYQRTEIKARESSTVTYLFVYSRSQRAKQVHCECYVASQSTWLIRASHRSVCASILSTV